MAMAEQGKARAAHNIRMPILFISSPISLEFIFHSRPVYVAAVFVDAEACAVVDERVLDQHFGVLCPPH
jgi:hypothetical protein